MKHILGTFELILDSMLIADTALDIIEENARQNLIGRGPWPVLNFLTECASCQCAGHDQIDRASSLSSFPSTTKCTKTEYR